jgi:hypothetical protein
LHVGGNADASVFCRKAWRNITPDTRRRDDVDVKALTLNG